jgi:tetratricopeptide (TPR) repeat protein
MARTDDRELFHAADDLALFLHDLTAAKQLLDLAGTAGRGVAFRDSTHLRRALLGIGAGRWRDAGASLARAGPARRLARAFVASLPFAPAAPEEWERAESDLEHWNPVADPPPAASALEASLAPHLRQWLLGLVSLREGNGEHARERALIIERMKPPPGAEAVVRSMAATLQAGAAAHRRHWAEALRLLKPVQGNVPAALLRVPYYAEEPARYLRAEVLQQLGRDREALEWLRHGFADTPAEVAYLAPIHLRQAEIYERLGDRQQAADHYARFLQLWEHCDPELQPLVNEVKGRLARLAAEPRQDSSVMPR